MSKIASVSSIGKFHGEDELFSGFSKQQRSLLDLKIQGLVSSQIKSSPGTLLATASLPCILDLMEAIAVFPDTKRKKEKSMGERNKHADQNLYSVTKGKYIPIGLPSCEPLLFLNALMQFILFIPDLREIFSVAPHSFQPINDFIEQYLFDQGKNRTVSCADTNRLIQLLFHKLPSYFFRDTSTIDLAEFLFAIVQAAFGKITPTVCNSIAFCPEWHAKWDPKFPFSCAIDLPSRPPQLLVSIKNTDQMPLCLLIQRQFFTNPDSFCYDLDAFIEYQEGYYAAYLKTADGVWYRCLDTNVMAIRSTHLQVPLARSIFLHYTRIWP